MKRKVFAAGHELLGSVYRPTHYKLFLSLIALHTSIFLLPLYPPAGLILLIALIKGWLNA